LNEEAAQALAATVTVDTTNYSISFNEFLRFISQQQEMEPDEDTLVDVFASFDKKNTGKISEKVFKQIMIGKDDVNESDIEEMLEEYYRIAKLKGITSGPPSPSPSEAEDIKKSKRKSKDYENWKLHNKSK
jgi:aldehyde:ferredoxin oxidoreductase